MQNQFITVSCHSLSDDDQDGRVDSDDDQYDGDDDDGGREDDGGDDEECDDDAFSLFSTHLGPWHADPN